MRKKNLVIIFSFIFLIGCGTSEQINNTEDNIINVPSDYPTIQSAINNAKNNDIIILKNGIYYENLIISNKNVTITSNYHITHNEQDINSTIIDGNGGTVVTIDVNSTYTSIVGLTIQNGNDGIMSHTKANILNNIIKNNIDGIDYENGGGLCKNNIIIKNTDDAIDLDGSVEVLIDNNNLSFNKDDGIEIRLHPYSGEIINIDILNNKIDSNGEDGIQLIGYNVPTNRKFNIRRNLIINTSMSAIGYMDNQNTLEDYSGAQLTEEAIITNNTFVANNYGITGGANSLVANNIFEFTVHSALKNILNESLVDNNLFWDNNLNFDNTNIDTNLIIADPLLKLDYSLSFNSPAIDNGINTIYWKDQNITLVNDYNGLTSDLGFIEYD